MKKSKFTTEERVELEALISKGKADARKLAHARVLLQADQADGAPARTDGEVASALDMSTRTVERVRPDLDIGRARGLDAAPLRSGESSA